MWSAAALSLILSSCGEERQPSEGKSIGSECTSKDVCKTKDLKIEWVCGAGLCEQRNNNAIMDVRLSRGPKATNKNFKYARLAVVDAVTPLSFDKARCPTLGGKEVTSVTVATDKSKFNLSTEIVGYNLGSGDVFQTPVTMNEQSSVIYVEVFDVFKTELEANTQPIATGCWDREHDDVDQCTAGTGKKECIVLTAN